MSAVIWILIAAAVIAVLSGGKNGRKTGQKNSTERIDHPHVITDDEYECPACGARFARQFMTCPRCGLRFSGTRTDYTELDEEEEELEAWDEEDGI